MVGYWVKKYGDGEVDRDQHSGAGPSSVGDGGARLLSGEYGSSWPGVDDTTGHVDTTVAKAVGEARLRWIAEHSLTTALVPRERVQQRSAEKIGDREETVEVAKSCLDTRPVGIAKQRAATESDVAVSVGDAGLSWPREKWTPSASAAAAIKLVGEARPLGITKRGAVTEREVAESSSGVGPSWSRAHGSAAAVADVKSAGKDRPLRIAEQSATTEPELAESSDEVGPGCSRGCHDET